MGDGTSDPGEELVDTLVQLSFTLQTILARAGAKLEVSIVQARLLGIMRDREPTMLQLARYLSLDKSSVTGLVDRAQRRGFLRRIAAPEDGRSVRVTLTPRGRKTVEVVALDVKRQVAALLDDFSDLDREQLSVLANRILVHDAATKGLNPLDDALGGAQGIPSSPRWHPAAQSDM